MDIEKGMNGKDDDGVKVLYVYVLKRIETLCLVRRTLVATIYMYVGVS